MVIAKIRKQNRITIPQDVMDSKNLHIGDEIYFEIGGVIGRDVFISHSTTNLGPVVLGVPTANPGTKTIMYPYALQNPPSSFGTIPTGGTIP